MIFKLKLVHKFASIDLKIHSKFFLPGAMRLKTTFPMILAICNVQIMNDDDERWLFQVEAQVKRLFSSLQKSHVGQYYVIFIKCVFIRCIFNYTWAHLFTQQLVITYTVFAWVMMGDDKLWIYKIYSYVAAAFDFIRLHLRLYSNILIHEHRLCCRVRDKSIAYMLTLVD